MIGGISRKKLSEWEREKEKKITQIENPYSLIHCKTKPFEYQTNHFVSIKQIFVRITFGIKCVFGEICSEPLSASRLFHCLRWNVVCVWFFSLLICSTMHSSARIHQIMKWPTHSGRLVCISFFNWNVKISQAVTNRRHHGDKCPWCWQSLSLSPSLCLCAYAGNCVFCMLQLSVKSCKQTGRSIFIVSNIL